MSPLSGERRESATDLRPPAGKVRPASGARRLVASFPVPKPLSEAIAAGRFRKDERGPIRPSAEEVRAITENHAHQLIELLHAMRAHPPSHDARTWTEQEYARKLDAYRDDFGTHAADRLDAYCRRQEQLQCRDFSSRSCGR